VAPRCLHERHALPHVHRHHGSSPMAEVTTASLISSPEPSLTLIPPLSTSQRHKRARLATPWHRSKLTMFPPVLTRSHAV
jgi:hypothetical protein